MCSFEWIGLHFKAIFRRLAGGKSREINTEMQFKTPKMHLPEFRNTLLSAQDVNHRKKASLRP
jgi:hypothetical protein